MDKLIEYQIPYKGLSIGKHDYKYHATDKFFADMQVEGIQGGDLNIEFVLDKQSTFMQADITIEGSIKLICDRCLDLIDYKINIDYNQIFKYGVAPENHNDDIIYLSDEEYEINTSKLIAENVYLQIPIRKVHPEDKKGRSTCKTEQIELIESYANRKQADHRWDALKNIKFDD